MTQNPVEITIDSIGGLGDGIGHFEGKPVFVPKSCAGDRLSVNITQRTKEFTRAEIAKVLSPGADRVKASCMHYSNCGSCSLQHLSSDAYRTFKHSVLANAFSYGGFVGHKADIIFLPPSTRRRVDFALKHTPNGVSLAYYGLRSHQLEVITQCPVLLPALEALLPSINIELSRLIFARDIESLSLTVADIGIDMLLTFKNRVVDVEPVRALGDKLKLSRISIKVKGNKPTAIFDPRPVLMKLGSVEVALPAESFLQAAAEGQKRLTDFALKHLAGAASVVDLFCGIGSYSFPVNSFAVVHAVELQGEAVDALKAAIASHKTPKRMTAEARDLFKTPLTAPELNRFDAAILNPPRAGAKAQTEALAGSRINRVVMISCNPASFARDAKTLKDAGFTLREAFGLDQFVWSPHLEIAAYFTR